MNNKSAIEIYNLVKKFGKKEVLNVAELSFQQGSVTALIGPSGAGKSTLLRILNLLEQPSAGKILLLGHHLPLKDEAKMQLQRNMAMVFQRPTLFDLSVYDNIAFGLRAHGIDETLIKGRVAETLEMIDMKSQRNQRAKTLSGGEAQRVAFARALVLQPKIIFLDEPTANLDPVNVEILEKMIMHLNKEFGTTVLIVTHNLFQAQRLSDETVFLYQGKLIEAGNTKQIFESPRMEQTRSFVEGKMIY